MPFTRPTLAELITRTEQDIVSRLQLTAAVLRRSLVRVLARATAALTHGLYGYLDFLSLQIFPDTSESEFLRRQASLFGVFPTAATFAAGNVTFSGSNDTIIPADTILQRSDGVQYSTDSEATISSGTATVAVTALIAGDAGNADAAVGLALVTPIGGVNSSATVAAGGLTLGTDAESDDDLRTRLIDRMRNPPQGGSENDYLQWARAVPGVTRAWVFPAELGVGTVTVRFVRDNDSSSIVPDAGEVSAVQDYIDERRPVTAQVTVVAPIAAPVDFTIELTPDTTATRAAVEAELRDLLARDEIVPGGTLFLSQIRTAIGLADGVTDFDLTVPASNVTNSTGEMPTFGVITWV